MPPVEDTRDTRAIRIRSQEVSEDGWYPHDASSAAFWQRTVVASERKRRQPRALTSSLFPGSVLGIISQAARSNRRQTCYGRISWADGPAHATSDSSAFYSLHGGATSVVHSSQGPGPRLRSTSISSLAR